MEEYTPAIKEMLSKQITNVKDVQGSLKQYKLIDEYIFLIFEDDRFAIFWGKHYNDDSLNIKIDFVDNEIWLQAYFKAGLLTDADMKEYRIHHVEYAKEWEYNRKRKLWEELKKEFGDK